MAGLLDGNYTPDPLSMGLLALGSSLMTPRAMGGGIGPGMQAFAQQAMAAQQMRRQMEQDALQRKLFELRLGEFGAQTDERRARVAEAQRRSEEDVRRRQAQDEFWSSLSGGNRAVIAQTGGLAPTNANAALRNQPMPIGQETAIAAARAGIPLDMVEKLSGARNWGRDKVAGTIETTDAQGRPVTRMRTDYGDFIGDALPKPYEKRFQDTGGSIGVFDPFTIAQAGNIPKTLTPGDQQQARDAAAGRSVTMRGQDLTDRRARELAEIQRQTAGPKPVWDSQSQSFVFPPSADNPAGRVVQPTGPDGKTLQTRKETEDARVRVQDATDALALADEAEKYLDQSTGSYIGRGADYAARVFGLATPGDQAAARLKAIEGFLILKMPKLSGPQSDKDAMRYQQAAGQIGDATLPVSVRRAALETVRGIQIKYGGIPSSKPAPKPVDLKDMGRSPSASSAPKVINFGDLTGGL
jgi:hypothetical protein